MDNSNEATPLAPSFQILKRPNVSGLRREEKEKINSNIIKYILYLNMIIEIN